MYFVVHGQARAIGARRRDRLVASEPVGAALVKQGLTG